MPPLALATSLQPLTIADLAANLKRTGHDSRRKRVIDATYRK
jgi:hypothetical protein